MINRTSIKELFFTMLSCFMLLGIHNQLSAQDNSKLSIRVKFKGTIDQDVEVKVRTGKGDKTIGIAQIRDNKLVFEGHLQHPPAMVDFYLKEQPDYKGKANFSVLVERNAPIELTSNGPSFGAYGSGKNLILNRKYHDLKNMNTSEGLQGDEYAGNMKLFDASKKVDQNISAEELIAKLISEEEQSLIFNERIANGILAGINKNTDSPAILLYIANPLHYADKVEVLKAVIAKVVKKNPNIVGSDLLASAYAVCDKYSKVWEAQKKTAVIGKKYTDIQFTDRDGGLHKLSDYVKLGKYVLLDFWASWCGGCRVDHEEMLPLYNELQDKGFEIIGVSTDRSKKNWLKALDKDQRPWPNGINRESSNAYGVRILPSTFLISPNGVIIAKEIKPARLEYLMHKLLSINIKK